MKHFTILAGGAAAALTTGLLVGCSSSPAASSAKSPIASATTQAEPPATGSDDLSFAAGSNLEAGVEPAWSNGFVADSEWTEDPQTDPSQGKWFYTNTKGDRVELLQMRINDRDAGKVLVPGNDLETSKRLMMEIFAGEDIAKDIRRATFDVGLANEASPKADFVVISEETQAGDFFRTYVRAFSKPEIYLLVDVTSSTAKGLIEATEDVAGRIAVATF